MGMFTHLAYGTAICLHFYVCIFSVQTSPFCPERSGAVPLWVYAPASPKEISGELALIFSIVFPWGKSSAFLGIKL